jgi:hypothetical protein
LKLLKPEDAIQTKVFQTADFGGPRSLDRNWADLRESPAD